MAVGVLATGIFLIGLLSMLSQGAVQSLTSIPFAGTEKTFLDIIAEVFSDVSLPLGGMLMSIFIAYKWKTENMSEEIQIGNGSYIGSWLEQFLNVMISYIVPVFLAFIFISNLLEKVFGFTC